MGNTPCNRFPSGPAYDRDSKYPPAFPCASQDCDYAGWTLDEMPECIVCKSRFCRDCLREIGGEKFCPACAKCACGQPALISCDECGSLVCERHMAIDPVRNECKACRKKREEEEYRGWAAYYGSQYYGGWNRDPKDGRYKPQAVIDAASERKPAVSVQPEKKAEAQ